MTDTIHTRGPGWAALAAAGLLAIVSAAAPAWAANEITWAPASSIIRLAKGCGDWAPTWAADGNIYTPYGDCNGVSGTLSPKRSMGLARATGSPATGDLALADIDTGPTGAPDIDADPGGLDALGDGKNGKKPSGLLAANGKLYAWVRNIKTDGTQSRLRYSLADGTKPGSTWAWASWTLTQFGYPVFVQAGKAYAGIAQRPHSLDVLHEKRLRLGFGNSSDVIARWQTCVEGRRDGTVRHYADIRRVELGTRL